MLNRLILSLLEALIVFCAALLGARLAEEIAVIPRWLIKLPQVDLTSAEVMTLATTFGLFTGGVAGLLSVFAGPNRFDEVDRFARAFYGLVLAITLSAVYVFLGTQANFDPQTVLAAALLSALLYLVVFVVRLAIKREMPVVTGLLRFGGRLFTLPFSNLPFMLVPLIAATPVVIAMMFVANRDFANYVTQLRISLNSLSAAATDMRLINAYPGVYWQQPMMVRFDPAISNRHYVLERGGKLFSIDTESRDRKLLMDLSAGVGYVEVENGALGFDLHPDFGASNQFVYIYFTSVVKDVSQSNVLARYDLAAADPLSTEFRLIDQKRNTSGFHNGGSVEFGQDGFLYLAVGEASVLASHQRIDQGLWGGILRIDVDQLGGDISRPIRRQPVSGTTQGYFIPTDNPFLDQPVLEEFVALGLRNPYRMTQDRATGDWWIGEVGSTKWEEVNRLEFGANYQFPFIEGQEQFSARPDPLVGNETPPVFEYIHTANRRAIIGGFVYRGVEFADLSGRYLYADNYSGEIFALDPNNPEEKVIARASQVAQRGVAGLVSSPQQDVYVISLGAASVANGTIERLVPESYAEDDVQDIPPPPEETAVTLEMAEILYNTNCARCHGRDGKANTEDALSLGVPIADFTTAEFAGSREDLEIRTIILKGGYAVGKSPLMPPWEALLSEAETDALVNYVRAFAGDP